MGTDNRSERVWLRLVQAYGSRVADSYGPKMPKPWADAVDDLTDEQIAYGLRKVIRDTPIHPPTLGQFVAACADMPLAQADQGASIQAQLCAYVMLTRFPSDKDSKFTQDQVRQSSAPWNYQYREWVDDSKPKHSQNCAECTGVLVPAAGALSGFRVSVIDMLADSAGHAKAMRSFKPGTRPVSADDWLVAQRRAAERMNITDGDAP
jgi:hypothetical protein